MDSSSHSSIQSEGDEQSVLLNLDTIVQTRQWDKFPSAIRQANEIHFLGKWSGEEKLRLQSLVALTRKSAPLDDREYILKAVKQYGRMLYYASQDLRADREVALAACKQFGKALKFTHPNLKSDREIVLAAVTQDGTSLEFASAILKNYREVVKAAVTQNATALHYASDELKEDPEIVKVALRQNSEALEQAEHAGRTEHSVDDTKHACDDTKQGQTSVAEQVYDVTRDCVVAQFDNELGEPNLVKSVINGSNSDSDESIDIISVKATEDGKDGKFSEHEGEEEKDMDSSDSSYQDCVDVENGLEEVKSLLATASRIAPLQMKRYNTKDTSPFVGDVDLIEAVTFEPQVEPSSPATVTVTSKDDNGEGDRTPAGGLMEQLLWGKEGNGDEEQQRETSSSSAVTLQAKKPIQVAEDTQCSPTIDDLAPPSSLNSSPALPIFDDESITSQCQLQVAEGGADSLLPTFDVYDQDSARSSYKNANDDESTLEPDPYIAAYTTAPAPPPATPREGEKVTLPGGRSVEYSFADSAQHWDSASILNTMNSAQSCVSLEEDRDFVLGDVAHDPSLLQYCSDELKGDKEIVIAALKQDMSGEILRYASDELKNDKDVVMVAIKNNWTSFRYASLEIRDNFDVVLFAIKINSSALMYASSRLKEDESLEALANRVRKGQSLKYQSSSKLDDKDFVLSQVQIDGTELEFVSTRLRDNCDVVLAAVGQNGLSLAYASPRWQNNYDVVIDAVNNNGLSLEFASDEIRDDQDVVEAAIKSNCMALEHASYRLRNDHQMLIMVNELSEASFEYLVRQITDDSLFQQCDDSELLDDFLELVSTLLQEKTALLQDWLRNECMARKLESLVQFDRSILDVENEAGLTALEVAIPACRRALERGLRLFGRYEALEGDWEYKSSSSCIFKVSGYNHDGLVDSTLVLKCMSNMNEVQAELESRKGLPTFGHVTRVHEVFIDASQKKSHDELMLTCFNEGANAHQRHNVHLQTGLEQSIADIITRKATKYGRDQDSKCSYKFVLVLDFYDKSLERAVHDDRLVGTSIVKTILTDVAQGLHDLHCVRRVHGDLKPACILRDGAKWLVSGLDSSAAFEGKYCGKGPSSGWSPPEATIAMSHSRSQSLEARAAHDLWSFGALIYFLETGSSLFITNDRGNLVEKGEVSKWNPARLGLRMRSQGNFDGELLGLLESLLDPDSNARLGHFGGDPLSAMKRVMETTYFNGTSGTRIFAYLQRKLGDFTEASGICIEDLNIEDLNELQSDEMKRVGKRLGLNTRPTSCVLLNTRLPVSTEAICPQNPSQSDFEPWKDCITQAIEWSNYFATNSDEEFLKLVASKEEMYFYWIDELAGRPVQATGFPIVISNLGDTLPLLIPYMRKGLCAAAENGTRGVVQMFGFPSTLSTPSDVRSRLLSSVETLRRTRIDEDTPVGVHGLSDFVANNLGGIENSFAGLRRVVDVESCSFAWTVASEQPRIKELLDQRRVMRDQELKADAEQMRRDYNDLSKLRNNPTTITDNTNSSDFKKVEKCMDGESCVKEIDVEMNQSMLPTCGDPCGVVDLLEGMCCMFGGADKQMPADAKDDATITTHDATGSTPILSSPSVDLLSQDSTTLVERLQQLQLEKDDTEKRLQQLLEAKQAELDQALRKKKKAVVPSCSIQ